MAGRRSHKEQLLLNWFSYLFGTGDFMPRRLCGTWSNGLMLLHICSDLIIFVCYMMIPIALWLSARNNKGPKINLWLFITFIVSCGMTHINEVVTFWYPAYVFFGIMKAITAAASSATVFFYFWSAGRGERSNA